MANTVLGKVCVTPKGKYSPDEAYEALDIISYGGNSFLALKKVKGVTPAEGESYMLLSARGMSGVLPIKETASQSSLTLDANKMTSIAALCGPCELILGEDCPDCDNEWAFILRQGETAYDVILPEIEWTLGIAPAFAPSSVTEVRLHYVDGTLKGVWI